MNRPQIIIYTDGGCAPNPGPGGWGALLLTPDGECQELSGGEVAATNNRMELRAAVEALHTLTVPSAVTLYTDSEYVRKGITVWLVAWLKRGWRTREKTPVKNRDLWEALHAETRRHTVTWQWVRGHDGNAYNERVDQLATNARLRVSGQ